MAIELDPDLANLYVRALLAVARADREIDASEGARIDAVIQNRFPRIVLAELLFEPTLRTDELSRALGVNAEGGPFRNYKADPKQLGSMFVEDALAISSAKDGLSSAEESTLVRFAMIFGLDNAEVRSLLAR